VASEAADDMVLALNEAATNAILYVSGRGQPVQVAVHVNGGVTQASVLDHDPDLPSQSLIAPTPTRWVFAAPGLWLLRRLVDEVRLERVRLGTRVTLRRRLGPPGRSPACSRSRLAVGDDGGETAGALLDEERCFPVLVEHLKPMDRDPAGDHAGRGVHRMGRADRGGPG
jgi:anti-sigma regulatory factor (Ser/Thr protein kinase)